MFAFVVLDLVFQEIGL